MTLRGDQMQSATAIRPGHMPASDKATIDDLRTFVRGSYPDAQSASAAGVQAGQYFYLGTQKRLVLCTSVSPFDFRILGNDIDLVPDQGPLASNDILEANGVRNGARVRIPTSLTRLISFLQTAFSQTFAPFTHTHSGSQIVSGSLPDGVVPVSAVRQHEAELRFQYEQILDVPMNTIMGRAGTMGVLQALTLGDGLAIENGVLVLTAGAGPATANPVINGADRVFNGTDRVVNGGI